MDLKKRLFSLGTKYIQYILFINGIKEIITMKLWYKSIKNNIKLKDIGEKFFKLNQESESSIKISDLDHLNKYTEKLFKINK